MVNVLFVFGSSLLLSLLVTPAMIAVSKKRKIFDMPDARKKHKRPTPLLGGLAIYFATIMATILSISLFSIKLDKNIVVAFLIGITGVTIMGLIDDILSLSAVRRLVILFSLSLIILFGCLQFYFKGNFSNQGSIILISVVTLFWIVGVTNAVNFSDGMDGLAGTLTAIAAASFAVVFFYQGRTQLALPTVVALFGGILGFLPYNMNPAKIFMGDAGSMFIGFMLGIMSMISLSQQHIEFCVVPVFFLLIPILDMVTSVLRRLIMHKPVMKPDNLHFHHKLLKRLKSPKIVLMVMALLQIISAGVGLTVYFSKAYQTGWVILILIFLAASTYTCFASKKIVSKQSATKETTAEKIDTPVCE